MEYASVAAAVGVGGYVGHKIAKAAMPAQSRKRKASQAISKNGFSTKIRRPTTQYRKQQMAKGNDMNTHFEVLKDMKTIAVTGGQDKFFRFGAHNLHACPSWNYWAKLFDKFKVHWIRVKLHMPGGAFVASMTDVDELTLPNDFEIILRNAGARVHDTTTDKHMRQRYLPLAGTSTFQDFVATEAVATNTLLGGGLNPDQQVPGNYDHGKAKAMICFGVRNDSDLNIHCALEYGVTFKGLQDSSALYAAP